MAKVSLRINLFQVYRAELIGKTKPEKKASLLAAAAEDFYWGFYVLVEKSV